MGFEPGDLVGVDFGGGFAEVADGFEGDFAGDVVGLVVGRGLEGGGPAVGGVEDFGQGFAEVGVAGAVVVEVVGELVGDGGELDDEVVGILFAAGAAGFGVEVLNLLVRKSRNLTKSRTHCGGRSGRSRICSTSASERAESRIWAWRGWARSVSAAAEE